MKELRREVINIFVRQEHYLPESFHSDEISLIYLIFTFKSTLDDLTKLYIDMDKECLETFVGSFGHCGEVKSE